jgi:G patch domain-containing protein 1
LIAGFGLGALNDADEDDLDVYDSSVNQPKPRVIYDSSFDDAITEMSTGKRPAPPSGKNPPGIYSYFHDGTPVLPGFVLSDKKVQEDRWSVVSLMVKL